MVGKYDDQIIRLTGQPLTARVGSIREALGQIAEMHNGKTVAEFYAATELDPRVNIPANSKTIDRLIDQGFLALIATHSAKAKSV